MEDEIIAVMGATGSGKSSLIKLITEDQTIKVGHGLTSETQEITSYHWSFAGCNLTLVDTPGFDDTYRSDGEILQSLVKWLTTTYRSGTKLSGIIYMHRITDVRMQGSTMRNLRVFRELCGDDFFGRVMLCASFWDTGLSLKVLEDRFTELTINESFWGGMIDAGSKVFREPLTRPSAIRMLFELRGQSLRALKVQREVVDEATPIEKSSAVSQLMAMELERQDHDHANSMASLKEHFEQQMRVMQRTHSENLEGERRAFEERLAESEAANERVRADIGRIVNQTARPDLTQNTPPPMYRASTTPADHISVSNEIAKGRTHRYNNFAQYMDVSIQLLMNEKQAGRVKCNLFPQKSCYLMVCTNCLRNIGSSACYKCFGCSKEHEFVLCVSCFEDNSVHCNNPYHDKKSMLGGLGNLTGSFCPRIRTPPQTRILLCTKCHSNVGKCYLHCCSCTESFDMCLKCATLGKHCPGHRAMFKPHKLEICARYDDV